MTHWEISFHDRRDMRRLPKQATRPVREHHGTVTRLYSSCIIIATVQSFSYLQSARDGSYLPIDGQRTSVEHYQDRVRVRRQHGFGECGLHTRETDPDAVNSLGFCRQPATVA